MKYILTFIMIVAASVVSAESFYTNGRVVSVDKTYTTRAINKPIQQCQDVEVPIYGTVQGGGASGGDVLAGMIIGGLLGKGVTGKDDGAAAGAVMGGIIAADKGNKSEQVITGYRMERQCTTVNRIVDERVHSGYNVDVRVGDFVSTITTNRRYRVGDKIPVTVSINLR